MNKERAYKINNYYGVHVGGGWLGILKRDGYCDTGDAYHYTINCAESKHPFFIIEDPDVSYKDSRTPDSWIIFSKHKVIPAEIIELTAITREDDIEEESPPDGM